MELTDIPLIVQALGAIGAIGVPFAVWLRKTAREGVEVLSNGCSILTKIFIKVEDIDRRLSELRSEMIEVQNFMHNSQRDRATLHLEIEDLKRRIADLEIKIRDLISDHN